ncbi:MAG TPA: hypothetical protein VFZ42_06255 [Chitinophagaceae bacterium]
MKTLFHITATVDQPDLLKNLVEKLAYRKPEYEFRTPSTERTTFDTSSTVAYVSGNIGMDFDESSEQESMNIPFITCFLFTCIKFQGSPYQLAWSSSLS